MKKFLAIVSVCAGVFLTLLAVISFNTASANRSSLVYAYQNDNTKATTSISYMTAGVSTTTSQTFKTALADQLDLNIMMVASSTASTLNWRYEFSDNNVDWYTESGDTTSNATTSIITRDGKIYSWVFASSTSGTGNATRAFQHIKIKDIAAAYTRVIFFIPPGSTPAGVNVYGTKKEQLY